MPRPTIEGLKALQLKLGPLDRERAEEIAAEWSRRTGLRPNRSEAIRWALRELRARIELERLAEAHEGAAFGVAGPMTRPRE